MDIFRFTNPTSASRMERGLVVPDIASKMWVERFREAGEFEILGPSIAWAQDVLPRGSYISHPETDELMKVEDHALTDDGDEEPLVSVTGRGIEEPLFRDRIIGSNRDFPTSGALPDYNVPSNPTWTQAVYTIRRHIQADQLFDAANAVAYFETVTTASGDGELEARTLKRGQDLYEGTLEILEVDDLGIKVLRPGRSGGLASSSANCVIVVHKGEDRSDEVIFSYDSGDVESADYLWSDREVKNAAYCYGKWVDTVVTIGPATSGLNRRWMAIDMSDLDQAQTAVPTGTARGYIEAAMQIRGKQILAAQKDVALAKAEISQEAQAFDYRTDYNVGDLVTVTGNFSENTTMRVTEHVEIEDDEGFRSYPTLKAS